MEYNSSAKSIKIALTGDSIITRRARVYTEPEWLKLLEWIRSADVSFTNAEMLFHDYESSPGAHQVMVGTYMRSDPVNISELQWMGFNLVSAANNHAFDYGEAGLLTSLSNLKKVGLTHAGAGRNLAEAREPAYLETDKGRVALIACTDSGPAEGRAGEQRRDMLGRPGVSWLRSTAEYHVSQEAVTVMKEMSSTLGFERRKAMLGLQESDSEFHLLGQPMYSPYPSTRFVASDTPGVRRIPDQADLDGILQQVAEARRMADWVIVTMHNHEGGNTPEAPGDHMRDLAHASIDAGADVFVGHGPHRDRGIEIYKGHPIFYALGDFFLENDTVLRQPQDNYAKEGLGWEATPADFYDSRSGNGTRGMPAQPIHWANTIAEVHFEAGVLSDVKLLPVDLGFGQSRAARGRPVLATGSIASLVLERQVEMSAAYGTDVIIDGDCATIKLK